MSGIGGFGAFFDLKPVGMDDPVLVSSTDGVGTKIKIAIDMDKHDTIGIDAVAMCVNDLIVQGGQPLFFLDYFATGKLVNDVAEQVIAGVAEGCLQSGCALIGGETAEMPGLYAPGDYDLAGFAVGAVERAHMITGETIAPGDVILGLSASGLHSNGFSLVRKVLKDAGLDYESPAPFVSGLSVGEAVLTPTKIYVKSILSALEVRDGDGKPAIKGMAHITGGGLFENVPRVLPSDVCAHIDAGNWRPQNIFRWLADAGSISAEDMLRTLNCGIGYIVVCAPAFAQPLQDALRTAGETVQIIGEIKARQHSEEGCVIHNASALWA
jgi:phosphoribosylformylglycinamidine cyclo-ligase